jgi:hypothetical protein
MLKELIMKLFPKKETKYILAKRKSDDKYFRFKVQSRNQIYLDWFGYPFPLEMQKDGTFICKKKGIRGYNRPYPGWEWIEDDGRKAKRATF